MTKLKVVVEFSVYNQYYKPPKMKAKLDKKTGMYIGIDYDDDLLDDKDKPSCVKCWFLAGMRWCCVLDGTSKNHFTNRDYCKTLIDINEGQYFTRVLASAEEGI